MNANNQTKYTVKEMAELSGVSVRTLRFYDEIGLLKPAFYGDNGYRYYQKEQLLLLQQVLFYRELGIELAQIQKILSNPGFDKVQALKSHRENLEKEVQRTQALIQTIDKTLALLEEEIPMRDEEMYYGFDPKKLEEYVQWTREKFGDSAAENYEREMRNWYQNNKNWSKEDAEKVRNSYDELHREFTSALNQGLKPNSAEVQTLVARHYQVVLQFWTPNKTSYIGLGRVYCEHPDYRKLYDRYHPSLAEYLADAINVYAEKELQ